MKKLTALATATLLLTGVGVAQARDLGPDEALKLRDSGKIKSFEVLNQAAIAKHPGSTTHETELEEEYGLKWDLELDATTGEVLKDQRDD